NDGCDGEKTYLQPGAENSRGRSSVHSSLVEEKRGRNGAVSARLCPLSRWRPHLSEEGVFRVWASRNVKRYILHRVYLLLPTLLGALTLVFFLIHLIPGDPIEVMLGETASAADKEELRRTLGLNQPVASQYKSFLNALAHGNLGQSLYEQASVADLIRARLPATIELTLCAMAVALLISFPLATLASVNKDTWIDRFALLFSLLGLSMPNRSEERRVGKSGDLCGRSCVREKKMY